MVHSAERLCFERPLLRSILLRTTPWPLWRGGALAPSRTMRTMLASSFDTRRKGRRQDEDRAAGKTIRIQTRLPFVPVSEHHTPEPGIVQEERASSVDVS